MAKKTKRKKAKPNQKGRKTHWLSGIFLGWIGYVVVLVLLCPILWFALRPIMDPAKGIMPRLGLVFLGAIIGSAFVTYLIDSILRKL